MPWSQAFQFTAACRLFFPIAAAGLGAAASAPVWRAILLTVAVALGGCAVLPSHVERPVSSALVDTGATALGRIAAASLADAAGERSAFRLLPDGADALEARLALIERAERTIDLQYYLIASDATGREFLRAVTDAAARGVRVRVLVDDLYATGEDALFAGLATQRNVEVRLFNPLPVRSGTFAQRIAFSLHQFSRINHRMHNKLFIADGSFAITGGRNIADEYFDRSGEANFIDMDVLSSGRVVQALAAVFDRFWNSEHAYPVQSLVRQAPTAEAFARMLASVGAAAETRRADAARLADELASGRLALDEADAEVLADSPDKAGGDSAAPTVAEAHRALIGSARTSLMLASPYFVPGEPTMKTLSALRANDVDVSVLTNSLATTDEPLVHIGYARHRAALLRAGVDLHELMPSTEAGAGAELPMSLGSSGRGSSSLGRLHTKISVVDGDRTFLGSMNLDSRSARLNTEAGIIVHSAALARQVAEFLRGRQDEGSYEVRLRGGRLSWLSGRGADQRTRSTEPAAATMPALPVRLLARMVGEDLL